LAFFVIAFGAFASLLGGSASSRRGQFDASASRLGKADGDGLFARARAMVAFADVMYLFANEFARLRGRSFAFPFVFCDAFHRFSFWHNRSF
jgi:hypothetical protein